MMMGKDVDKIRELGILVFMGQSNQIHTRFAKPPLYGSNRVHLPGGCGLEKDMLLRRGICKVRLYR